MPLRISWALAKVPVDPDVSERAGVHDLRGVFHPRPRGTGCGIYSQSVNHDLTPEISEQAQGQEIYSTDEKYSLLYTQRSRQGFPF